MSKALLPEHWHLSPLEKVASIQTGIAKGKTVNGCGVTLPYLRVANVQDGHVDLSVIKEITVEQSEVLRYSLRDGDVLFTEGGDFDKLGRGTVWHNEISPCLHQNHVFAVRPKAAVLLPEFLAFQAASRYGRRYFQESSKQSTNLASINSTQLKNFPVLLAPIKEQGKIVEVLRTWDEAIDKLQALAIAQRKKHSQATDALLFSKESGRRKKCGKRLQQLADVTRELTQRNNGLNLGREFVMGVSNSKGIVPMREQSIGGDLSRYKVLPPRAFAYNPMRINVGSIAMSRLDSCVLVSPDYVLFECVDDRLDPDYLDHLCNTHWWSHHINAGGSGSVRMRTYYDDLAALRLELPDFEEQKEISAYLNAARREHDLIADQINALERQKRGLMQKLLTGEWRVKGFGDKESE